MKQARLKKTFAMTTLAAGMVFAGADAQAKATGETDKNNLAADFETVSFDQPQMNKAGGFDRDSMLYLGALVVAFGFLRAGLKQSRSDNKDDFDRDHQRKDSNQKTTPKP